MPTHRTMLFDHCVITFPVSDGTTCRPDFGATCCHSSEVDGLTKNGPIRSKWFARRRSLPRAILAGIVILLIAAVLTIAIGITWNGAGQNSRSRWRDRQKLIDGDEDYRMPSSNLNIAA